MALILNTDAGLDRMVPVFAAWQRFLHKRLRPPKPGGRAICQVVAETGFEPVTKGL